ncbi:MAG: Cna B-type domain-containing protein [Firmicutes bacterium]|nr:Cna B-type domain-containing protein [Bacillota bacterium]
MRKTFFPLFLALLILFPSATATSAAGERDRPFRDVFLMTADPDTSGHAEDFPPSTVENGRIWVDKSVNADDAVSGPGGGSAAVYAGPDEFMVTLSALSQGYSVDTVTEPTDAVFIVDVSKSMDLYKLGDMSRAEVMVDALNHALKTLLEANPDNRVAVVCYGGYLQGNNNVSRINKLLSLGHYTVSNGRFFSISGDVISVNPELYAQTPGDRTVLVSGATPTQRGIYEGAKILMDNADTTKDYVTEKGKTVKVTRRPALILLTDGEPTLGWRDYRVEGASTDKGYDSGYGPTSGGDLGMSFLAVATASYWKQKVGDHYYGVPSERSPWFYTIGVGVSSDHAKSVMNPAMYAGKVTDTYNKNDYNLKTLLDAFISGAKVTFPALNKNSSSARSLMTTENFGGYIKSYAYTDGYFQADDRRAVMDAFESIAALMVSKGHYATDIDPAKPDLSGYLVISDILGEHMAFRGQRGFEIAGEMTDERHLAMEMSRGPASPEWDAYVRMLAEWIGVGAGTAADIIGTSAAGGSLYYNGPSDYMGALKWYAGLDTEYMGPYYNTGGEVNPPPPGAACVVELHSLDGRVLNEVTGEDTNLMYTHMLVITALRLGGFGMKNAPGLYMPLAAGQQMVRWYIPASLIPMRTVSPVFDEEHPGQVDLLRISESAPLRAYYAVGLERGFTLENVSADYLGHNAGPDGYAFYSNDWRYGGELTHDTAVAIFKPNKKNPYYFFQKDTPVYANPGDAEPAESYVATASYYWLNEYFDETAPGYVVTVYEPVDKMFSPISVSPAGVPYIPAGTRKPANVGKKAKSENRTRTYDFALQAETFGPNEVYMLGNNGRLDVGELTGVTVRKVWDTGGERPVWARLYADGVPAAEPVELKEANDWTHTWDGLMTYSADAGAGGMVSPIIYTVAEGHIEDGEFVPYDEGFVPYEGELAIYAGENSYEGFEILYEQPVWDDVNGVWTEAVIYNTVISPQTQSPATQPPNETEEPPEETPPATEPPEETPPATEPPEQTPPANEPPEQTPTVTEPPEQTPPATVPPVVTPPPGPPPGSPGSLGEYTPTYPGPEGPGTGEAVTIGEGELPQGVPDYTGLPGEYAPMGIPIEELPGEETAVTPSVTRVEVVPEQTMDGQTVAIDEERTPRGAPEPEGTPKGNPKTGDSSDSSPRTAGTLYAAGCVIAGILCAAGGVMAGILFKRRKRRGADND